MEEKKVVYFETERGIKGKVKRGWYHTKKVLCDAGNKVIGFVAEHPAESAAIASATAVVTKKTLQYAKVKAEDRRRDCELWDPSAGMYAKSRKPLTEEQKREISREKKETGKFYGDILYERGLSKK